MYFNLLYFAASTAKKFVAALHVLLMAG